MLLLIPRKSAKNFKPEDLIVIVKSNAGKMLDHTDLMQWGFWEIALLRPVY